MNKRIEAILNNIKLYHKVFFEIVIALLTLLFVIAIFWPSRPAADSVLPVNELGKLYLELQEYAEDHDWFMPESLPELRQYMEAEREYPDALVFLANDAVNRVGDPHTVIVACLKYDKYIFYLTLDGTYGQNARFEPGKGELPVYYYYPYGSTEEMLKARNIKESDLYDLDGQTLLNVHLIYGEYPQAMAIIARREEINTADPNNITPLMRAVSAKNYDVVKALLDQKADIAPVNIFGDSAMDIALKTKDAKIINLLIPRKEQSPRK